MGTIRPKGEQEPTDFQRPNCTCTDPRGGFKHSPEFEIQGSIDGGGIWSSSSGNSANRFVN
jgi:hypothetical protein